MYTFRVIDGKIEEKDLRKNGIGASRVLTGGAIVDDALKSLKTRDNTAFVSVSPTFMDLAVKTNMSHGNVYNKRDNVAIIDGIDGTHVKPKSFYSSSHSVSDIKKVPLYAMENLVLDCSKEESIKDLAGRDLVNNKRYGFVLKEDGILVYYKINGEQIKVLLNPLYTDVLYALLSEYGENHNNIQAFINMVLPFLSLSPRGLGLSESEVALFNAMYKENKAINTIMDEIIVQNKIQAELIRKEDEMLVTNPDPSKDLVILNYEDDFDILSVVNYIKNKKRIILSKIFNKCGFVVNNIRVVEDELQINRLGNVWHDRDVTITYNGVDFIIPVQQHFTSTTKVNFDTVVPSALLSGDTDSLKDNRESLEAAYKRETEVIKLSKTPKK